MTGLSMKERVIYRFILNEDRVYKHWYSRFLICGVDVDRIRRVISRIRNFYSWCSEWSKEGETLERLAKSALANGDTFTARSLFREAVGCFHVGQHIYFLDIKRKMKAQDKARENYRNAIDLYDERSRPIRVEVPFRKTVIPGYLRLTGEPNKPLVILVNGLDNIKEAENHYLGTLLLDNGLNALAFDGPGQGEMWEKMKMIPDYEKAVSTIIDWLEKNNRKYSIDLRRIATCGLSFGGYLSPRVAAFEKRISCAVGNGGPAYLPSLSQMRKVNPIWIRDLMHVFGFEDLKEAKVKWSEFDIRRAPRLDRPFLFIQGGQDKLIPDAKGHADCFMDWAIGEKELKYYPDGEHCAMNYIDEVIPYTIDWLRRHLSKWND